MNIDRCFELFLTDRKISGCSEATLVFYDYVVGKLLRYIEENNLDSSVESTHQHILYLSADCLRISALFVYA